MFEQSMISAISEHLNKSKGGNTISPSGAMSSAQRNRRSMNSVYSNTTSHARKDSDMNDDSASDYMTQKQKSSVQIKNQTFGPNSSVHSNLEMLSPGMKEEGIANIAITNNDFVSKAKQAAKARLQELKQSKKKLLTLTHYYSLYYG